VCLETSCRPRVAGLKTGPVTASSLRSRQKFLRLFPSGFEDQKYIEWERNYKWNAHQRWNEELNYEEYRSLLVQGHYVEIADRAVKIESRTNLLFSFEKMAIRDAVKSIRGACAFASGLYDFLHGSGSDRERFDRWCSVLTTLPRKKTRVSTWPVATVFGFIALPTKHMFLKPTVTRVAAREYGFGFDYSVTPSWKCYKSLLYFAGAVRRDLRDLGPKDMIDIQSFMWVQGSDEYSE
jgi:hypothetical protein